MEKGRTFEKMRSHRQNNDNNDNHDNNKFHNNFNNAYNKAHTFPRASWFSHISERKSCIWFDMHVI